MIEIKGNWIGYYTFDERYGDWGKDRRVPFRMAISRGINQFVGRVFEDTDYGGIDDEITIKGRQNGDEIEFEKHYTKEHFLGENSEQVAIDSENPTIVYYKGKFDFDDNQFKGLWEIPLLREDDDGVFHADNDVGEWFLWRES
ncbi:MAG: hypothetical protein ACOYXT_06750 [Bacteroidota bacterium]